MIPAGAAPDLESDVCPHWDGEGFGTCDRLHSIAGFHPLGDPRPRSGYRVESAGIRASIDLIALEARQFGDLLALGQLVEIESSLRAAIADAGASLRAGGATYGELGAVLGISKQAARLRFPGGS